MREQAKVVQTSDGWIFSSRKETFKASVEVDGNKASYSSVSPSLFSEATKALGGMVASATQLALTKEALSD